ncbi:hypothetical protein [Rhizobium sp. NFR03]|uniref:hypothetical protein n=1 Tax=Rhizobium sp. NFR03 TaxID=1566263 RepID=UPI0008C6F3AC|nr:hypothetical protein [Rhizobium sp. NFR03]SER57027.1 hypothetical protein SAMN03159406_00512 [Rhizobium sp. NFR03]
MLGYEWNDGGINNQKLALLGLVVAAYEQSKPLYLPKMFSKDQRETRSSLHDFGEIFDEQMFMALLARWDIARVDNPAIDYADRIERNGWKFFDFGAWILGSGGGNGRSRDLVPDFFRSLVPLVTRSPSFLTICSGAFTELKLQVVNQLRIEEDWRIHCQYSLEPTIKHPEDYNLSAPEIIKKTKETLGVLEVLVSCDERYVHIAKKDLTKEVYEATGVNIYWKSDFLARDVADDLTPIAASLIDFELAKLAKTFVGMSRSTFANLATFERFCRNHQDYREDYIYNLPSSRLGLRVDLGRSVNPLEVCGIRAL